MDEFNKFCIIEDKTDIFLLLLIYNIKFYLYEYSTPQNSAESTELAFDSKISHRGCLSLQPKSTIIKKTKVKNPQN